MGDSWRCEGGVENEEGEFRGLSFEDRGGAGEKGERVLRWVVDGVF